MAQFEIACGGCVLLLGAALAMSVIGCSFATGSGNVSVGDLTGVWVGKLTVDHVHGQAGFVRQDISFTLASTAIRDQWFLPMLVGRQSVLRFQPGRQVGAYKDGFAGDRDAREDGGRVELLLPRCSPER